MLWLNGKYDPIIKFREWYRLRSAVWDVKKTVGKKILEGEPLEVAAAELASNIPRLDQLANAYQGGESKEFPRSMLFSNRPEMLDHYISLNKRIYNKWHNTEWTVQQEDVDNTME